MNPDLQKHFESLEQRKQTFMTVLETSTPQQQTFKPKPEAWNMLGVAQHLIQVERGLSAPAFKNVDLGPSTLRSKLNYWLIFTLFKTPLKVKVPEKAKRAADPAKGETPTLDMIQTSWQESRELLRTYLEDQPASALSKPVTRHPYIDPMTLSQMLGFFNVHLTHHQLQLNRLQSAANFPK
jgi:DinB superfamily